MHHYISRFFLVEQVDLFAFPPVCLPLHERDFEGLEGIVAGKNRPKFREITILFVHKEALSTFTLKSMQWLHGCKDDLFLV